MDDVRGMSMMMVWWTLACTATLVHIVNVPAQAVGIGSNDAYQRRPGYTFPVHLKGYVESSPLLIKLSSGSKLYSVVSIAVESNGRRNVKDYLLIQVPATSEPTSQQFGMAEIFRYEEEVQLFVNGTLTTIWRLQSAPAKTSATPTLPAIEVRHLGPRVPFTHAEILKRLASVSR